MVDWDGDGKQNLLIGTDEAGVLFYRNVGTATKPKLAEAKPLPLQPQSFKRTFHHRVDVTDWNNDGKPDLLVGNLCRGKDGLPGNVWLFLGK